MNRLNRLATVQHARVQIVGGGFGLPAADISTILRWLRLDFALLTRLQRPDSPPCRAI